MLTDHCELGRTSKLNTHQQREAIKRRDKDGETLRSISRSYNVGAAAISRLSRRHLAPSWMWLEFVACPQIDSDRVSS
jgi:Zn-dependent peptidase ImmA (M78 family)